MKRKQDDEEEQEGIPDDDQINEMLARNEVRSANNEQE